MFGRISLLLLPVCLVMAQDGAIAPKRPTPLFNQKNLDGWYTWLHDSRYSDPRRVFSVTDKGEIRISGEEWGGITTRDSYRNYHLTVEWRWGGKTWGERENRARDSGILIHGRGEDGAASGNWLESFESQIIEGGTGDIILVSGKGKSSASAKVRVEGRENVYDPDRAAVTLDRGRINWWGRSPEWKDVRDFRGAKDVERPVGEWNRQEIFVDGDSMTCVLNGRVVNHISGMSSNAGKIQIQSEGAEIIVRKVEIRPLGRIPAVKSGR